MWLDSGSFDLTYCTNIHPGETWPETRANIEHYALGLKTQLAQNQRFGIGLRLSAIAATQLLQGEELPAFKRFLDESGLYVAIINGFPFGSFHCVAVKSGVFAPDWQSDARVRYTLDLVRILAYLLPDNVDGGISTIPLSYKPWLRRQNSQFSALPSIVGNIALVVEELVRIYRATGKLIHIDIEPEPDGLVETSAELIDFFANMLCQSGAALLSGLLGTSEGEACEHLMRHVRVCFDTCHLQVEYEELLHSVRAMREHGISIGRLQVSSAIRAVFGREPEMREQILAELKPFAESNYLHQVIERRSDRSLLQYPDLDFALEQVLSSSAQEWRVHYHVPLFTEIYGALNSTQQGNREILAHMESQPFTTHVEIETYTWDVLPKPLKLDLLPSIAREYQWVLAQLGSRHSPRSASSIASPAIKQNGTLHA